MPAIVPNFGSDNTDRKLAIICSKGNLDMAYPGLILANAAMHLPGSDMHIPQAIMPAPGMTAVATKMLKKQITDLGLPEVPDFLHQIVAVGGHLWA